VNSERSRKDKLDSERSPDFPLARGANLLFSNLVGSK
jgi:hypothetical protein